LAVLFDLFFIMLNDDDELLSLHDAPIDNLSEPHVAAVAALLLFFAFLLHSSMSLTTSEKRTFFTLLLLLHLKLPSVLSNLAFFE
jgi:hypothetical protein